MKSLALVALVALSAHAGPPRRPKSEADKDNLLGAKVCIELGLKAKVDMEKARVEARKAKDRGDKKSQLKYLDKADSEEFGVNFYFNRALVRIADAYHFKPEGEIYINTGPLAGRKVPWRAKYVDDNAQIRKIEKPGGGDHYTQHPPQNIRRDMTSFGYTDDDGEIAIRLEAFELAAKNPSILGSILYHETVHYEKMTSKDPPTPEQKARPWPRKVDLERVAYEEERKQAKVFRLPKAQADELESNYQIVVREAAKAKPIDALAGSPFSPIDQKTQSRYKEWYEAVERVREELKEEKRKLEEDIKRDEESKEERQRHLEDLRGLAAAMCKDPDNVPASALAIPARYESAFYDQAALDAFGAASCETEGFIYVLKRLAAGGPIDRDRMIRYARIYGGAPPTPPYEAAGYLRTIAMWACHEPGSITYERFIVYVDRWHFPNPRLRYRDRWAEGLDACASELYWKLIGFNDAWPHNQTLNPDWLNAEGKRLKEKHAQPQPQPARPGGGGDGSGDGESGSGGSGRRGGIDPKPSMPRDPNWDGGRHR
ncbi:MAG: hypothetical protein HY927_14855 [Elusimicrobia bacterium]|nr:hypothetical protein [Elusimicrobiota bacterium]